METPACPLTHDSCAEVLTQPFLPQGDIAHVVVMPNITIALLEEFMNDLIASRSKVAMSATAQLAADARALQPSD